MRSLLMLVPKEEKTPKRIIRGILSPKEYGLISVIGDYNVVHEAVGKHTVVALVSLDNGIALINEGMVDDVMAVASYKFKNPDVLSAIKEIRTAAKKANATFIGCRYS